VLVVSPQREIVQEVDGISPVQRVDKLEVLLMLGDEGLQVLFKRGKLGIRAL
jgi:hypothetical protein